MGLVPAKCTQCGANIEVDETREAGICQYCGTAFITEKAICNYNVTVVNNNDFNGAVVNVNNSVDIDALINSARKELVLRNFENANIYLDEIRKNCEDGTQRISQLFSEIGVLQWAEESWRDSELSLKTKTLMDELKTYDSQNIEVWLFILQTARSNEEIKSVGDKILTLASECENAEYYKRKVYTYYIEMEFNDKRPYSSGHIMEEIPKDFIAANRDIQDLIVDSFRKNIIESSIYYVGYRERYADACSRLLPPEKNAQIQQLMQVKHKGCYIATCIYGSYDCREVWTLRRFRDTVLDATWFGRLFIKIYYQISPVLVERYRNKKWFRMFWKTILDRMVAKLNSRGLEDTEYFD